MISFNQIGFLPSTNIVFGDSAEGRFTYSTGFYYSVGISNDIVNMPSISLNTSMVNANLPSVGSQNNVIESDGFNLYYNPLANSKRHRLSYLDDLNKPINLRYGNYSENSYNSNTNYRTPSIKGSVNFFTGSTLNLSIINNGKKFIAVIILNVAGRVMGIKVGGVSDVITLREGQIQPAQELGSVIDTECITRLGTVDERMLIWVDIEKSMSSSGLGLIKQSIP